MQSNRNRIYWSDEYLIIAEENFTHIFMEMYEEQFIDNIFLTHESRVSKEDWVLAIAGDFDDKATCSWIFSPAKVRKIFQQHVDITVLEDS